MAGHGLFTHIRRIKQEICDVPSPLLLVSIPGEELVALVPESPYPMPTEPLWNVPYSTPYCECIAGNNGPVGGGGFGGFYPLPPGGWTSVIYIPTTPVPAVPEPTTYLLLLLGGTTLWMKSRKLSLRNS